MKRLVIIPTYKEKENIENIIRAIYDLIDVHILIIDDNSPDGTADIVKARDCCSNVSTMMVGCPFAGS